MGGFINSQSDAEICEVLNKRFSDNVNVNDPAKSEPIFEELRDFFQNKEDLFDNGHHLHRVFHRLAISVSTGGASVPKTKKSRLRWFFLLQRQPTYGRRKSDKRPTNSHLEFSYQANPAGAVDYVTFSTVHVI